MTFIFRNRKIFWDISKWNRGQKKVRQREYNFQGRKMSCMHGFEIWIGSYGQIELTENRLSIQFFQTNKTGNSKFAVNSLNRGQTAWFTKLDIVLPVG